MKKYLTALGVVALFVLIGLTVRHWGFSLIRISGTSMEDTLQSGDVVLVTRWDYLGNRSPGRMDVVECRFPNRRGTYVKRVIGLPGESLSYRDGQLTVDGQPLSEPYILSITEDFYVDLAEDEYFVMGDNRMESYDSRAADMGAIDESAFVGRVRWIFWPLNRFGPVN